MAVMNIHNKNSTNILTTATDAKDKKLKDIRLSDR